MTATLAQVRDGLKARVATLGLNTYAYIPGDGNPPMALIRPPSIEEYSEALRSIDNSILQPSGWFTADWEIHVLVTTNDPERQLDLYEYEEPTGTLSFPQLFESDRTLGGLTVDAFVSSSRPLGMVTLADKNYFGVAVTVRVVNS